MWENLSRGFVLFVIGVAKKVALADTLAMVADPLFGKAVAASLSAAEAWIATGAYTLQIYFDFSGYSDMAIGLALMFGLQPAAELQRAVPRACRSAISGGAGT